MSHRDSQGSAVRLNSCCLKLALQWLLQRIDWSSIQLREDCTWTPLSLATAALLWAWSDELTLVDRFQTIRKVVLHLFPQLQPLAGSYQAFMKMLCRWTKPMIVLLQCSLREQQQLELADYWLIGEFALFAVDGSRTELPRTRSNEHAYSASRKLSKRRKGPPRKGHAKKANSPQLWLTTMWPIVFGTPIERAEVDPMLAGRVFWGNLDTMVVIRRNDQRRRWCAASRATAVMGTGSRVVLVRAFFAWLVDSGGRRTLRH